ncbi:DUF7768 domain-containing protein [Senegalia sp. (in: firmicutes)]|uniref:DUF7768 domain-containing protein n=1 Tax=Senegalia sp. (in: firmicutes) TaxID=1924098 RepID=UPI003F973815
MLYNNEGYLDPTAHEAIKNIENEKKIVFICSPYKGDIEVNTIRAKRYGRYATSKRQVPIIPHLMYPRFLNEDVHEERQLGLEMGLILLSKCQELWVFGSRISTGMSIEIEKAKEMKIPIRYHDIHCRPIGGDR